MLARILFAVMAVLAPVAPAHSATICTLLADPQTRDVLLAEGDCQSPVTPASTFKVALAVMGFDAGILASAHEPVLPFKQGDPDWGGAPWRQPTDPEHWMAHSVVWYSQRLTEMLGAEKLTAYGQSFGYGNADFSGDPGQDNGLERAWISSSLKISPLQQAGFLAALVTDQLPVSSQAQQQARTIVQSAGTVDNWTIFGKTGSAYPRNADRSFDYARGWGWYVGWAERDGRQLVFVRLDQDEQRYEVSGGLRARDALLAEWSSLVKRIGEP